MDGIEDAEMFGNRILKWVYERLIIQREIKFATKWLASKSRRIFDIGCGTGWTTLVWQNNGFDVTGLEPSLGRSKMARNKYGLKIFNGHIEEFQDQQPFDVVAMRHILEHIELAREVLKKIQRMLDDNGLLVITVPNINSIGRYAFRESWE